MASDPNPYESPKSAAVADGTDTQPKTLRLWQRTPSTFALAAFLCFIFSFTLSAITYVPPRPILPDVIAGVLFLLSIAFGALAIWGSKSRGRKR